MNTNNDFDEELKDLPPFLKEMKKNKTGFSVPENYFESVESEIFKNIDAIGARRKTMAAKSLGQGESFFQNVFQTLWQPRVGFALAASLVMAFAAFWFFKPMQKEQLATYTQVEISDEEAADFVLAHVQDFDPNQLAPENEQDIPSISTENPQEEADFDGKDIENLLEGMSDEDLEELL
jgi:hypothetical protein